ncbi:MULTISPECIES: hypothetical protein [Agrobacterium]|uniref:Uncharacterized protein n=1 Tax=Agrobacterium tumefaciens TaxID=358 RepID=A0AAE6EHR0_AGRTU|nr:MULTISPECIES: hypothetical protein [Agrobacterium]QCL76476.1 hypothetical protein CFBP5499_24045 [Agrobacterium tumefaciens]QCL81995.1 hypothetical protein CFBP5877_23300 [Agrobacterium tumefaciens]CUX66996.1 conserved hypothetical protein [Agrobacterium sp. NCPPB 925]
MSLKSHNISRASEAVRARRILEATSAVSELVLRLQADHPHRSLDGILLVVSDKGVALVPNGKATARNSTNIPMPRGTRVRHLLAALMVEDGDVELAIKVLTVRLAEANEAGKTLNMYQDEAIGGPSVALHLAVRAFVDVDV